MSNLIKKGYANERIQSYQIELHNFQNPVEGMEDSVQMEETLPSEPKFNFEEEFQKLFQEQMKVEEECRLLRIKAQEEMENTLAEIEKQKEAFVVQCEQWKKEANEQGYNKGYKVGLEEGKLAYESKLQEARQIIEVSKKDYLKTIEDSEDTLLQLSCSIASRVVRQKLNEEDNIFASYIRDAVKQVKEAEEIRIRIAPENYERLLKYKDEFQAMRTLNEEIYIVPDEELDEFSCYIDTEFGRMDISVDAQFQELRSKLEEMLGGDKE